MKITCPKYHQFEIRYNNWYNGQRCPVCFGTPKHSYEYIKQQFEKENYFLKTKEYKNNKQILEVICPEGHEWNTTWNRFVTGARCFECSYISNIRNKTQKHSLKYIKNQYKKFGYKFLSEEYKNAHIKYPVKCPEGHQYLSRYNDFRIGCRCPDCSKSKHWSDVEKEIATYIKNLGFSIIENDRNIISPYELDIVIPSKKIAIEYCGLYWHSELLGKNKNYHLNKLKMCKEKDYRLITIFEDEWFNKDEIVKIRLKHILGVNNNKIYARKCDIQEIDTKTAKDFIDKYHIQGYNNGCLKLGAFYNNKLVSVIIFKEITDNIYDINRFCLGKYSVIGIAGKFLKYFQRSYNYKQIITFADRRWSEGSLYKQIGFEKHRENDPDYSYFKQQIRFHKFNFRRKYLENKLENFNPDLSEWENMKAHGWNRIWDCGKIKFIINK